MNHRGLVLALGVAVFLHPASAWSLFPAVPSSEDSIRTHIILRLKPQSATTRAVRGSAASGFGVQSIRQIHERFGITGATPLVTEPAASAGTHPLSDIWIVETPDGTRLDRLLEAYRSAPEVMYAELDRTVSLFEVNDSLYEMQWALRNTGQAHPSVLLLPGPGNDQLTTANGLPGADIHADAVINSPPADGESPVVAIVDTGVDPSHPELAGLLWRNPREIAGNAKDDDHNGYIDDANGWDHSGEVFVIPPINNGDANPADYHGHGTHCAGVVAARADNARGIAGVASPCRIMPVKIFPLALTSISARALVYAVDNGADVISMSWGGPWRTQVLEDAVHYALASGVVLCAAAGNGGNSLPMYPAAYPGVIAVGASDHNDHVTGFSNFGEHLSVVAPGLDILSLRAAGTDMYAPNEPGVHKIGQGYYLASGTSMAAPHVAGAVARLRAASPGLVPGRVRDLLELSAFDLVDPRGTGDTLAGRDAFSGAGRLDLANLMALAPTEAARITSPGPHMIVTGSVSVMGTAYSARGLLYVLECGRGAAPEIWSTLNEAQALVQESLLGEWATAGLDGLYTLRLRVGDSNLSEVRVYVGNSRLAEISAPATGDSVTSWVDLVGSVSDPEFHAYLVELGEGASPAQWTVVHQGTQPVVDGLLASWHGGSRPDGWYSLRLRLISDAGEVAGDTVSFYLRSAFSTTQAWKVPLGTSGAALVASFADLDYDGQLEIVVATSDGIRAFSPNGQPDAAVEARLARAGPCSLPLAIGDTDGDGRDDLVAVNDSGVIWIFPSSEQVRAIRTEEPPLLDNLMGIEEFILPGLFLQDSDGDNRDEIHYYPGYGSTYPRSYWIYRSDGSAPFCIRRERFATRSEFLEYFPADLNGDGIDEFYVARQQQLYRLNQSGAVEDSVALVDSTGCVAQARTCSALDLDSDGRLELVVMAVTTGSPSTYVLYVFKDGLALQPGWPRDTGIEYYWAPSDPVFCDIDGDGHCEYFISWFDTELGRISAWHSDGRPLSGHASYSVWTSSIDPAKFRSPVAADLNADGMADLISCATEDMYLTFPVERIIAWDQLGHVLPGWPVIIESGGPLTGSARRQTTACGDVDRNGITDVMMVTSENNLVFINVPGATFDSAAARVEFWRYHRSLDNTVPVAGQLRVESVTPTRLQAGVPEGSRVEIGFNLALDAAQDFASLFEVSGTVTGVHTGTVRYEPLFRRLTFEPHGGFLDGETVSVRIPVHLRSETGGTLAQGFQTTFMVGARRPEVVAPYPAPGLEGVEPRTSLAFGLTTAIDVATIGDTTLEVTGNVHGLYAGSLQYDTLTRVATFVPSTAFAPAEVITATVRPGVTSTLGIVSDSSFSWSFTIVWPQAQSTVPAPFTPGAPRSTYVSAVLDGVLPEFAVHDSAMLIHSSTAGRHAGAVTFIPSTRSLRFTPASPFRPGDRITAVAPALHQVWSFSINTLGGPVKFAPPLTYPTDASPRLVTAGDLDGDGTLELVVARAGSPFVYLLRHSGPAAFMVDSILTGGTLGQALLADLDGDFDLDLLAVDQIGDAVAVLRNLGQGRFTPPAVVVVPGVLECGVSDFNSDGHLDLYSQAMSVPALAVLLGRGDGTFLEMPRTALPAAPVAAAAFDMDGDGRVDLATADSLGNVSLLKGDGAGSFKLHTSWNVEAGVRHLIACDADRDGDADLAVLAAGGHLGLWRNDGGGSYALDMMYDVASGATQVQCADLDADGRYDLAVARGERQSVLILRGVADGGFVRADEVRFPDSVWSVEIADFDSDGDLDLAAGGSRSVSIAYYGSGSAVGEEPAAVLPDQFGLSQNYPNPFNPATALPFAVPEPAHVRLEVFNVLGQRVAVLRDEVLAAGYYTVSWDGRTQAGVPLPSGMYFYRLSSDKVSITRRMLLLK